MASDDPMTYDEVLAELQMTDEELERLLARTELKSVRVRGTVRFPRAAVDELQRARREDMIGTSLLGAPGPGLGDQDPPPPAGAGPGAEGAPHPPS